jgi:hypothetical protein
MEGKARGSEAFPCNAAAGPSHAGKVCTVSSRFPSRLPQRLRLPPVPAPQCEKALTGRVQGGTLKKFRASVRTDIGCPRADSGSCFLKRLSFHTSIMRACGPSGPTAPCAVPTSGPTPSESGLGRRGWMAVTAARGRLECPCGLLRWPPAPASTAPLATDRCAGTRDGPARALPPPALGACCAVRSADVRRPVA